MLKFIKHTNLNEICRLVSIGFILALGSVALSAQESLVAIPQKNGPKCDYSDVRVIRMEHLATDAVRHRAKPVYPVKARLNMIEGTATVRVLVDRKGNVVRACAFQGAEIFYRSAEAAAKKWKFKPNYGLAFVDKSKKRKTVYALASIFFDFQLSK